LFEEDDTMFLTKEKVDDLLDLEKVFKASEIEIKIGENPLKETFVLTSSDRTEMFYFDVYKKDGIQFKMTYQNRYYQNVNLVRIDIGSHLSAHFNPDGQKIEGNHIHYYVENYGLKYAKELSKDIISDPTDFKRSVNEFLRHINVQNSNIINYTESCEQLGLF